MCNDWMRQTSTHFPQTAIAPAKRPDIILARRHSTGYRRSAGLVLMMQCFISGWFNRGAIRSALRPDTAGIVAGRVAAASLPTESQRAPHVAIVIVGLERQIEAVI